MGVTRMTVKSTKSLMQSVQNYRLALLNVQICKAIVALVVIITFKLKSSLQIIHVDFTSVEIES